MPDGDPQRLTAGDRTTLDGWPAIVAREGLLVLEKVQPAGKKTIGRGRVPARRTRLVSQDHTGCKLSLGGSAA